MADPILSPEEIAEQQGTPLEGPEEGGIQWIRQQALRLFPDLDTNNKFKCLELLMRLSRHLPSGQDDKATEIQEMLAEIVAGVRTKLN